MSAMKRVVMVLVLVALGANALPGPDCEHLLKTLPAKDLHQISGDWVLVWAVSDTAEAMDQMMNLSSSHVEVRFLPDSNTVMFSEKNLLHDQSCPSYVTNMSLTINSDEYDFKTIGGTIEVGGVVSHFNDEIKMVFFESSADWQLMDYRSVEGHFLVCYRREGLHRDVDQLKAAHGDHQKRAECLGFHQNKPFVYDGVSDFCHKKSSPDVTVEQF